MAGVFRKTMVYLGLLEHPEDEYEDELIDDDYGVDTGRRSVLDDTRSVRRSFDTGGREHQTSGALAIDTERRPHPHEEFVRRVDAEPATPSYRITTLHPTSYNDAKEIGERYRESVPVIMNLSEMDDRDAKRLVDFAAGLTFGLRGRLDRVTSKVFLLSPSNVEVLDEVKARLGEGGFFNQS